MAFNKIRKGMTAVSLAGHDTGKEYVVVDFDEDCVWLADGRTRTLEHPKKKKQKHVQLRYRIADALTGEGPVTDEIIAGILKSKEEK